MTDIYADLHSIALHARGIAEKVEQMREHIRHEHDPAAASVMVAGKPRPVIAGLGAEYVTIYGLCSTNDPRIRYVGQALEPRVRFRQHTARAAASIAIMRWLRELREAGDAPIMVELQKTDTAHAISLECQWIARMQMESQADLNVVKYSPDADTSDIDGVAA